MILFSWRDSRVLSLRYELQEQLWSTPVVTAYLAVDLSTHRDVELHFLSLSEPGLREIVERRFRLLVMAECPHLRRPISLELAGQRPFQSLEPLPSEKLASRLALPHPLSASHAVRWMSNVAAGVVAAHRQGLAHGDLAVEHVWIKSSASRNDDSNQLLVVDFSRIPERRNAELLDDLPSLARILEAIGRKVAATEPGFHQRLEKVIAPANTTNAFDRCSAFDLGSALTAWQSEFPVIEVDVPPGLSESRVEKQLESGPDPSNRLDRTFISDGDLLDQPSEDHQPQEVGDGTSRQTKPDHTDPLSFRETLGRFRLLAKLGEGGMGAVWKAVDPLDETIVAIKVLRADKSKDTVTLKRFLREARILGEVNNPHVANLLELNTDVDIHYLVMEFVDGENLLAYLNRKKRISERTAISIVADVSRALADAHEQGIIHRDLKPENILVVRSESDADSDLPPQVKLTDFGLARRTEESESMAVTKAGSILGTPLYLSPEQCSGTVDVDARADVYSLGATLFHLIAGRPPFESPTLIGLVGKHLNEPAPRLRTIVPSCTEAIEEIVARCLQKKPESRYANARMLTDELDRLLRGEPASIMAHPKLPAFDSKQLLDFDFQWSLTSPPALLWPHVSNTERLNKAIGLSAPDYTQEPEETGGVRRFAQFKKLGMTIAWQEHPFEWVEGKKLGVLREFHQGPWKWFTSTVELQPRHDGGTNLSHRVRLMPSNLVGRIAGQVEIGVKTRKALDGVYQRIDAVVAGRLGGLADPFEGEPGLPRQAVARLDQRLQAAVDQGADPQVIEVLSEFLTSAPIQELGRIRPLALARRFSLDEKKVLSACLLGASQGALTMLWDIVCPICRIPSQITDTLKAIREHGHCEACNSDFELDFANSIELIFRVASDLADTETGMYCIGGPAHSPHVVAQARLAAGERFELELELAEGAYRVRGPQLPYAVDFRVEADAHRSRAELSLRKGRDASFPAILKPKGQWFVFSNDTSHEIVIRVERTANRDDACTAARAAATPLFRELFPGECLAPEMLVQVQKITLLATRLPAAEMLFFELGDAPAFQQIHAHFRQLDEIIRKAGGTVYKTVGEGVRAVFADQYSAVRAAISMRVFGGVNLRVAVHSGPAMVATMNELLDYFGTTVRIVDWMLEAHWEGDVPPTDPSIVSPRLLITDAIANSAESLPVIEDAGLRVQPLKSPFARSAFASTTAATATPIPLFFELAPSSDDQPKVLP